MALDIHSGNSGELDLTTACDTKMFLWHIEYDALAVLSELGDFKETVRGFLDLFLFQRKPP